MLESWKPTEDIKEPFKKLTQQVNHEIDLCEKDLQKHRVKKGKVDLMFKSLLFLSMFYDPIDARFVIFFFLCLKSFSYFGD